MLAYHGQQAIKDKYVARMRAHIEADELVAGVGWEETRGCAVGCCFDLYDHALGPVEIGVPEVLMHLMDSIYEGLPQARRPEFAQGFLDAIHPGADLSKVWPRFAVWMLVDPDAGVLRFADERGAKAIRTVAALHERVIAGEMPRGLEAAGDKARAAGEAAYAAAWAVRATGEAAYAAAWAVRATGEAAYAGYASRAAGEAAAAGYAAREAGEAVAEAAADAAYAAGYAAREAAADAAAAGYAAREAGEAAAEAAADAAREATRAAHAAAGNAADAAREAARAAHAAAGNAADAAREAAREAQAKKLLSLLAEAA
jgi:hypothetical protein